MHCLIFKLSDKDENIVMRFQIINLFNYYELRRNAQIISEMLSVLENKEYARYYKDLANNLSEAIR